MPSSSPRAPTKPKSSPPKNVGGTDDKGGAVTGVVRFKGSKPEVKPQSEIAGHAFCNACYKDHHVPPRPDFLFGKNGDSDTLQNVLVYVSKGLEGKDFDPPKEPAVLDQSGCMYTPHVVAVQAGQKLTIRNSDATLHNVMGTPRANTPFNFGMSVKDGTVDKVFKEPEMKMNVKCVLHPWMSGYIHVLEHPYFAVTGEDGTFTLKGLPPGDYELTVLHESALMEPVPATRKVTIKENETATLDFTYQQRSKK